MLFVEYPFLRHNSECVLNHTDIAVRFTNRPPTVFVTDAPAWGWPEGDDRPKWGSNGVICPIHASYSPHTDAEMNLARISSARTDPTPHPAVCTIILLNEAEQACRLHSLYKSNIRIGS